VEPAGEQPAGGLAQPAGGQLAAVQTAEGQPAGHPGVNVIKLCSLVADDEA